MKLKINQELLTKLSVIVCIISICIATGVVFYYKNVNLIKTDKLIITQPGQVAGHFDRGKPIDRYYIDQFIGQNKKYIKGNVLEMSDDSYAKAFGQNIDKIDILDISPDHERATMIHDLQDTAWFPENKFDCYICIQTLQYLYDIKAGMKSAHKMLKKDGVLLVTAPGIAQLSYEEGLYFEYWHFTEKTLYNLAKDAGFSDIEVHTYGNAFATTAFLQGISLQDVKDRANLDHNDSWYPLIVTLVARK